MSEQPSHVDSEVGLTGTPKAEAYADHQGQINTREYHYTGEGHKPVIIQDHGAGHAFPGNPSGTDDVGPHFNVRPLEAQSSNEPNRGKVPGTLGHYGYGDWSNVNNPRIERPPK